jgi:hypothetical protein
MNIEEIAEEYRDVDGFNGYKVSNFGNLKNKKGKILKFREDKDGYKRTNLYKDNKPHTFYIHKLVAIAFIPNSENKPKVDHIDRNHHNNHISNLRWVTTRENTLNSKTNSRNKTGYKCISYDENSQKYKLQMSLSEKKSEQLGYFYKLEDAIKERNKYAEIYYGEYNYFDR